MTGLTTQTIPNSRQNGPCDLRGETRTTTEKEQLKMSTDSSEKERSEFSSLVKVLTALGKPSVSENEDGNFVVSQYGDELCVCKTKENANIIAHALTSDSVMMAAVLTGKANGRFKDVPERKDVAPPYKGPDYIQNSSNPCDWL